ncbi:hypothetical protein PENTCL1PPCAC_6645 [Pristionchus entomophagus]|uniref:Regulatory protein zeste n=1 Tax=Pristionchus entomophagus TaxID=358040 RepID=A0AAV5SN94_9BILA|nr:hypothetical protein PENTCL1PPCAC_6645 [Pristionchus entomophagus]
MIEGDTPSSDLQSLMSDPSTSMIDIDSPSRRGWSHNLRDNHREAKVHQRIVFARLVHKHRKILFGTDDGSDRSGREGEGIDTSLRQLLECAIEDMNLKDAADPMAKEEVWKWIQNEVKDLDTFKGKGWSRLRDHDWQYIRRHAVTRFENNSIAAGLLGELDEIVLQCINRAIHPLCDPRDPPRVSLSQQSTAFCTQLRLEPTLIESFGVKEEVPSTMDTLLRSTEEAVCREKEDETREENNVNLVSSLLSFIKTEPPVITTRNVVVPPSDPIDSMAVVPNGSICTPSPSSPSSSERAKKRKRNERGMNGVSSESMNIDDHEAEMRRLERKKKEMEIWMMEKEEARREAFQMLEMEHKRLQIEGLRRSLN